MRYRFGLFELDTDACTLTRSGRTQHLRPKVFDLLRFLIERRGRIVTKQELLDALWDAEHVNEAVVPWSITHARRALGQKGHDKGPIETLYSRGYSWRATVEVIEDRSAEIPRSAGMPETRELGELPFVGRTELMEGMRRRLTQAKAGHGALCLLVGEPGIGKTRCMDELAASARSLDFAAWSGRATKDHWAPAFWPWTQVLRAAMAERGLRDRAKPLLEELEALGLPNAEADGVPSNERQLERFRMLDGVSRFLVQTSRRTPLLILLDDLQWADAATIELLAELAPELRRQAVLIVASQRDRPDPYRKRRPAQLARYTERIELGPLTTDDVSQYIELVTQQKPQNLALSAAVHRATAGNALFLQETVRTLIAQHGASGLSSLSPTEVRPAQLARDVLRERLDLLDPQARAVLASASVLGESFDTDLLQNVCGVAVSVLLDALDAGTRAGLLNAEGGNRHRFCHALVRDVLYDELPGQTRIAAHRGAALAIERTAHIVPRHGELAHHYYRSLALGYARVASASARRAAEEAVRTAEFEDAVMFCQWALEAQALDVESTPRQRAELLLLRARSARHAGRGHDARLAIAQLLDLARRHGYADLMVRGARLLRAGRTWVAFTDPQACAALEEVLRIVPNSSDENRISALAQLASVAPHAFDMERSKALSAQALALALRTKKLGLMAEAMRARLYALSGPDDIDALLAAAREMLALDVEADSWISISAHSACYGAAIHRGDLASADAALAALGQTARKQRRPEALWYHDRLCAQRSFLDGGLASPDSAFTDLENMRLNKSAWMFRIPQALLAIERSSAPLAGSWDLRELVSRTDEQPIEYGVGLARIAARVGRIDLAQPVLERLSPNEFGSITKDISYLNMLVNLSLVAIALEDRARAESLYRLLAPYPNHNSPSRLMWYEGSVSHYLALLAEFLGDHARVDDHFDAALIMNESLGHKSQLARTCYEYARYLFGDKRRVRTRALKLKTQALKLAGTLGMNALATQARAL